MLLPDVKLLNVRLLAILNNTLVSVVSGYFILPTSLIKLAYKFRRENLR